MWQRDALRRLYVECPLSASAERAILLLCKEPHDLLGDSDDVPPAEPLETSHIPSGSSSPASTTVKSIRNVSYVNALADNQSLNFREDGLSVVFGNNASGKSGYARILKNVCRARSAEEILHNVYEGDPGSPASATLLFSIGGTQEPPVEWSDGESAPDALSLVSVFDSKCAPVHVEERNEAAYIPVPLQILHELASVARRLKIELQEEITKLERQVPVGLRAPQYTVGTAAGELIRNLSPRTAIGDAESLCVLSEQDQARLEELSEVLKSDPKKLVAQEEAKKARLEQLSSRVTQLLTLFSDNGVGAYHSLLKSAETLAEAASLAANDAFKDEPLQHVGSDTWRALWEAARTFSETDAYPETSFPRLDDAVCVLCQQSLGGESTDRFQRFEKFVKENAQLAADEAAKKLDDVRKEVESAELHQAQCIQDCTLIRDEIGKPDLAAKLLHFLRCCAVRRGRIIAVESSQDWPTLRGIDESLPDELKRLLEHVELYIEEIRKSEDVEQREKVKRQYDELVDRNFLATILEDVRAEISRQTSLAHLKAAIVDTDTNRITRKVNELADSLVTSAWRDRFQAEVSRLGIHYLRIELQREDGAYGAARFRVTLIRDSSAALGKVLSEGEYRCIALAAFLSELATAADKSAIVFDDPVSSLDHDHREAVAKRLAEEVVSGRQVIVFTHDVLFLELLSRHAKDQNAPTKFLTVNRLPDNSRAGAVEDGIPSSVAPADDMADSIRRQVRQFEGLHTNGMLGQWNSQTNSFSIQLRKCWERAVAEVVSPVVKRFDANVDTKNVWQIAALEEADFVDMRRAYKRCSELNHEKCAELQRNDPTPTDYYNEVTAIKDWIQRVRTKQEDAQQNRPNV
jgi:hypothetical protein